MREHWSKLLILGLLAVIVGTPLLLRPTSSTSEVPDDLPQLVVITPHNEQIRHEFGRAFNAWRQSQDKPPVAFDWRVMGGTSDLRKIVLSQLEAAAQRGQEDAGIGIDLFFGGGDFEHNQLAKGISVQRDGQTLRISAIVPLQIPQNTLAEVFPESTIGGNALYHPELRWVGVAMSSFGIVYNRDVLNMLDLPEPRTWDDLRVPGYQGWLALADPGHSGSIAATYNVIVRRLGWTDGWRLLRRVFANSRYFTSSAGKVPVDVSAGEAAAGMCIDFYGRYQAGAIGNARLAYVDPPFMTATTADPISILRGAPHEELANEFVLWLLSKPAQQLWQKKRGTPGGPERFELRRQPVRRDVYTDAARQDWTDPQIDPFATAKPIAETMPDFYLLMAPVAHAIAVDIHEELVAAWRAIQRTPNDDPRKVQMLRLFDEMPEELTLTWPGELAQQWQDAIADPDHPRHWEAAQILKTFGQRLAERYYGSSNAERLADDRLKWTLFFRDRYAAIVAMSAGD